MKLSHVSVLKSNGTEEESGYLIRAELEEQPTTSWRRCFQLTWLITPALRKLSSDIQFNRNVILLGVRDTNLLAETIEAVKTTLKAINSHMLDDRYKLISGLNLAGEGLDSLMALRNDWNNAPGGIAPHPYIAG